MNLIGSPSRCCCEKPGVPCGTCTLPKQNLALTLSDGATGTLTVPMVFDGVNVWEAKCIAEMDFKMTCGPGTGVSFLVSYHVGGACPGGTKINCAALHLVSSSCSPFIRVYDNSSGCASLTSIGVTSLTVTL